MYKLKAPFFWIFLWIFCLVPSALAKLPYQVDGQTLPSLAPMLKKVLPAVVNISSTTLTSTIDSPLFNDPFFRRFFGVPKQKREKQSRGSGVIINARQGYVVTNNHVIDKSNKISITLLDGRQLNAKLIGTDPETDIALLQVPSENLSALQIANSDALQVGDFVVAIGNPFGLGQTVTSGIVSALGRSGLGIEGYEDFIQTDASINPGNSGGALVNLRGELIGINTAILAPGGGNVGIGFAIPSGMMNQVIQLLAQFGKVERGQLGIKIQNLTPDLAVGFGLKGQKGAVITEIVRGGSAEQAGLQTGDLITAINQKAVNSSTDVRNRIGLLPIGERLKISIIRNGRTRHIYAVIADTSIEGHKVSWYLKGTRLKESSDGIQVREVTQGSQAEKIGLQQDDVIIGFNRREVKNLEDLAHLFRRYRANSIQIYRNDKILSIFLN